MNTGTKQMKTIKTHRASEGTNFHLSQVKSVLTRTKWGPSLGLNSAYRPRMEEKKGIHLCNILRYIKKVTQLNHGSLDLTD